MRGVYEDLAMLKPIIEKTYTDIVFASSMWESECAYHGWDWSKDDGKMKSMATITDSITEKFEEIYALILIGLGETNEKI